MRSGASTVLREASRFASVGFLNVFVDASVYTAFLKIGLSVSLSKGIAFGCGTVFSYLMNKRWSFENEARHLAMPAMFIVIYAVGLSINVSVNWVMILLLHEGVHALPCAYAVATAASALFNFAMMRRLFKKQWTV